MVRFVTAHRNGAPYLFHSYRHPKLFPEKDLERSAARSDDHEIWQVARATSAVPFYFDPMRLEEEGEMLTYTSGSFHTKNPSEEAYRSVKQANHNVPHTVKVFVSIGTGESLESEFTPGIPNKVVKFARLSASLQASSYKIYEQTVRLATENYAEYFRLNVQPGLSIRAFDVSMRKKGDETLELIRTKAAEYLRLPDVKSDITKIAKQLVDIRRQRSTWEPDLDRWERFCHGVEYACPVSTCKDDASKYKTRRSLRDHLKATHSIEPDELESLLDAGKRFPLDEVLE